MPTTNPRSGPGWAVFVVVLLIIALAVGYGFARMWQEVDTLNSDADALQAQLAQAQSALDASQLQIEDQAQQAQRMTADIESLVGAVSDLGQSVETQAERTLDITGLRDTVAPSVVNVLCGWSQGTGFAIEATGGPAGYPTAIITNHHVIAECVDPDNPDAPDAWVQQGEAEPATVLSTYDAANDLALLFVAADLPPLPLAPQPKVGDPVLVIGSPYGLSNTVTSGAITNLVEGIYTTDAAVGPGNSGGPMVNRDGEVLGVVSAELERSEGQNIAVPIDVACRTVVVCP